MKFVNTRNIYGSTSDWYKVHNAWTPKHGLSYTKRCLRFNRFICFFHVKFLSMINSKNSFMWPPLNVRSIQSDVYRWSMVVFFANIITFVLFILRDNLLTLNEIPRFSSSLLTTRAPRVVSKIPSRVKHASVICKQNTIKQCWHFT